MSWRRARSRSPENIPLKQLDAASSSTSRSNHLDTRRRGTSPGRPFQEPHDLLKKFEKSCCPAKADNRRMVKYTVTVLLALSLVILVASYYAQHKSKRLKASYDAQLAKYNLSCYKPNNPCKLTRAEQNQTIFKLLHASVDHRISPCDDFYRHTCHHFRKKLLDSGAQTFWQQIKDNNADLMMKALHNPKAALRFTKSKAIRFVFNLDIKCRKKYPADDCDARLAESTGYVDFITQFNRIFLDQLIARQGLAKVKKIRRKVSDLVRDVRQAADKLFAQSHWLDETTRRDIRTKLSLMTERVGFDEWLLDDQQLDSKLAASKFKFDHYMEHAAKNVAPQWPQCIDQVRSEFDDSSNTLYLTMGLLQKPFFEESDPPAIHYGWLGYVIAHSFLHGYPFDGKGWSTKSQAAYNHRAQCMIQQYGSIVNNATHSYVNGQKTLIENVCDNGGLKVAYKAFQKHQQAKDSRSAMSSSEYPLYTPAQLFFYSYAMGWCEAMDPQSITKLSIFAPYVNRVNTVLQNSPEFAKAFNCAPKSSMNPVKKCSVW